MMMNVIKGDAVAFVPFAPRLDIWYRSHSMRGTLPEKYKNASLLNIIDDLDIGFNTMIPDFLNNDDQEDVLHNGLGILGSSTSSVCRVRFHNVEIESEKSNGIVKVLYKTPYGNLGTVTKLDKEMKSQGITVPAKLQKAIKSIKDYKAAKYLFDNAEVMPDYERFTEFMRIAGTRAIPNCLGNLRASGIRYINMELMSFEQAVFDQMDYPDDFEELRLTMDGFLDRLYKVVIDSPAQIINVGAHFDATLTPPPFFEKYVTPKLKEYAKQIHDRGKYMACHTDSENRGLFEHYLKSDMDIADSVCTKPLVSMTYKEIRNMTKDKITLFGLIPSILMLENSITEYEFDEFIDHLFTEIQDDGARNIILAVADTTPPDAKFDRVEKIAKIVHQIKPV